MRHAPFSHRLLALAALFVVTPLGTSASARSPYADWTFESVLPDPPVPERFVLDNGIVVHFLPSTEIPVVSVTAIIGAGATSVSPDKTGLAGIVGEVLRTGGTKSMTPDELDGELEYHGMSVSSRVAMESATVSLRCLSRDIERGLNIFSDILSTPRFDSAKFALAVANAIEQVRRDNDSPNRIVRREFNRLIYSDHPYGLSQTPETLASLTVADVRSYYRQYYHPKNVILAVAGDLTTGRLKSLLGRTLSGWAEAATARVTTAPVDIEPQAGVYQIARDITQTNLRFGHLGIRRDNPDRHALRVMNFILGSGGFTSRMMGTVRSDSGFAYSVGTYMTERDERGVFGAYCQTKSETTARALGLMIRVIEEFRESGPTEEELESARASILNSEVFDFVTPRQIVERFARLEYFGRQPDQFRKDLEAIAAVTQADVMRVATEYLHPDRLTILAVGPIDRFDAPLDAFGQVTTIELRK